MKIIIMDLDVEFSTNLRLQLTTLLPHCEVDIANDLALFNSKVENNTYDFAFIDLFLTCEFNQLTKLFDRLAMPVVWTLSKRFRRDGYILIVEDNDDEGQLAKKVFELSNLGIDIKLAKDGEQALCFVYDQTPQLILLDLGLPKKTGFEVIKELRSRNYNFPIIVITASTEDESIHKAYATGADGYIVKPVDLKRLISLLIEFELTPDIIKRKILYKEDLSNILSLVS